MLVKELVKALVDEMVAEGSDFFEMEVIVHTSGDGGWKQFDVEQITVDESSTTDVYVLYIDCGTMRK